MLQQYQQDALPILCVHYRHPSGRWEGFLVIDQLIDNRAVGGCRMSESLSMTEVMRLARGMSRKNSMLALGVGGAKSGIRFNPNHPERRHVLETFFRHVRPIVKSMYGFGPDMNTVASELDEVAETVGIGWRLGALATKGDEQAAHQRYEAGLSLPWGPFTIGDARTGFGAAITALRAAEFLKLRTSLRVSIQGFGVVGSAAAHTLTERGHRVTCASDAGGSYSRKDGLDFKQLMLSRNDPPARLIDPTRLPNNVVVGHPDDALYDDCHVLVLACIPDAITMANVDRVKARIIIEAANIAITPDAVQRLHERGTVVIPDYIASGAAVMLAVGLIKKQMSHTDADTLMGQLAARMSAVTEGALLASRDQSEAIVRAYTPRGSGPIVIPT